RSILSWNAPFHTWINCTFVSFSLSKQSSLRSLSVTIVFIFSRLQYVNKEVLPNFDESIIKYISFDLLQIVLFVLFSSGSELEAPFSIEKAVADIKALSILNLSIIWSSVYPVKDLVDLL